MCGWGHAECVYVYSLSGGRGWGGRGVGRGCCKMTLLANKGEEW